jgi:hypothetical protein
MVPSVVFGTPLLDVPDLEANTGGKASNSFTGALRVLINESREP